MYWKSEAPLSVRLWIKLLWFRFLLHSLTICVWSSKNSSYRNKTMEIYLWVANWYNWCGGISYGTLWGGSILKEEGLWTWRARSFTFWVHIFEQITPATLLQSLYVMVYLLKTVQKLKKNSFQYVNTSEHLNGVVSQVHISGGFFMIMIQCLIYSLGQLDCLQEDQG